MTSTACDDQFAPEPTENTTVREAAREVVEAEQRIARAAGWPALLALRNADHALTMAVRADLAVRRGS